jgi:tripartite-type tricarboxylate transporter receptor subunit TctC
VAVLALASFAASDAIAQKGDPFPARAITIIVPYSAGGIGDVVTRIVADKVSSQLGRPVIVECKPGANSNIGTLAALHAPADGHTWLLAAPALMANPVLYIDHVWKLKDFTGVGIAVTAPAVVAVSAEVPANTLADFISLVRSKPGTFNYGNPGVGSSIHLNTEMLKQAANLDLLSVIYKGQPPALIGLLRNDVQVMLPSIGLVSQYFQDRELKALAVISEQRISTLPEIPTLSEAGYPQANIVPWYGFAVSAAVPMDIARKINDAINAALDAPDVKEKLRAAGVVPERPRTLEEIAAVVSSDAEKYQDTIRKGDLRAE